MKYITCFSTILMVTALAAGQVCSGAQDQQLTAKQLVKLIQASRQQYTSFDVEWQTKAYRSSDGKIDSEPYEIRDNIWRQQKLRQYGRSAKTKLAEDGKTQQIRTYAVTPQWSKRLQEIPVKPVARGMVVSGDRMKSDLPFSVSQAVWGIFGQPWELFASDKATLTHNGDNGNYSFETRLDSRGTKMIITVDPSKDYLPNGFELISPDGSPMISCKCSDFRKIENGLWLPHKYVYIGHKDGYYISSELSKVRVNVEIPEKLLDFSFPEGTIVNDQIANLRYTISKTTPSDMPDKDYLQFESAPDPNAKPSVRDRVTLAQELQEVDRLRDGFKTPFYEVERRCNILLKKYTKPQEQAMIYFELTRVEGQSGLQRPEKAVEYAKKALALHTDPLKRVRLYIYWGDAIQVANRGVHNQELIAARRKAALVYLDGLKETLKYNLPENKPDLPGVFRYDIPGDSEFLREIERKHQERLEAWRKAKFQREMIDHREVLISQISGMYSRFPWASDEIRELATKILNDQPAVDRLMSSVDEAVAKRVQELGSKPALPGNDHDHKPVENIICNKQYKIVTPDNSKDSGSYSIKGTYIDQERYIEIIEELMMDYKEKKIWYKSKVTYKNDPVPIPTKAFVETKVDGQLCMKGLVTIKETTMDFACEGFVNKRSGEKIDPPEKIEKKDMPKPKGLLLFQSALPVIGPKFLTKAGEIKDVVFVEFPDDFGYPELINLKEGYRLARELPDEHGRYFMKVFSSPSISRSNKPVSEVQFDTDNKPIAISLGNLKLVENKQ